MENTQEEELQKKLKEIIDSINATTWKNSMTFIKSLAYPIDKRLAKNGKLLGWLTEFALVVSTTDSSSTQIEERQGKSNNLKERSEHDIIINNLPVSIKSCTYHDQKSPVTQISTNYELRKYLEEKYGIEEGLIDLEKENNIVNKILSFIPSETIFITHTPNKSNLYILDKIKLHQCVKKLQKKKGPKHINFFILDKKDNKMLVIKYGQDRANAFQRGIWTGKCITELPFLEKVRELENKQLTLYKLKEIIINGNNN